MKKKIMIVEDSAIVNMHISRSLKQAGYEVLASVSSGEEALTVLTTKRPELILMDIMLEGDLDGIETANAVRESYGIPVIYLSALTDRETIERAKITVPFGYIMKPFEERELHTTIEMALYKHEIDSKLRESEERYYTTVKSITDALFVVDANDCITYANAAAEQITGWAAAQIQGKHVDEVIVLEGVNYVEDDEHEGPPVTAEAGTSISVYMKQATAFAEAELITKNGKSVSIGDGSVSPIYTNQNEVGGWVIIFRDITDKKQHQRIKQELQKKRLADIIEGQEMERERVARDLHDGLGQMLNAIKINLDNLILQDNFKEGSLHLASLIDEAIIETGRISENLLPSKLKDFDLSTCVASICNQYDKHNSVNIEFNSFEVPLDIDQKLKVNIFRIAQEALSNAIRHASASNITVQLIRLNDMLRLTVEDDGVGFKYGVPSTSRTSGTQRGLKNMVNRADILNGVIEWDSSPNYGTIVTVEIPLSM